MLTPQKEIGRDYESELVNTLIEAGVDKRRIKHNPFDDEGYLSSVGSGPDIIIDGWFAIECKFTNGTIHPSYVIRDWLPRLRGYEGTGVFACNDTNRISEDGVKLVKQSGYKSISTCNIVSHLISVGLLVPSITSKLPYDSNVSSLLDVNSSVFNGVRDVEEDDGETRRCCSQMQAQMVEILRKIGREVTRRLPQLLRIKLLGSTPLRTTAAPILNGFLNAMRLRHNESAWSSVVACSILICPF